MAEHLILMAALIAAPAPKDTRREVDPPTGLWRIDRLEIDGETSPLKLSDRFLKFTDHTMNLVAHGFDVTACQVRCSSIGDELQIDMGVAGSSEFRKGIYRVDGDKLIICEAAEGMSRPTKFESSSKLKTTLWILRKVK